MPASLGLVAGAGVVLLAVLAALGVGGRGRRAPATGPTGHGAGREVPGPVAGLFAVIEVAAISGVVLLLARTGHGELIVPAIALVVAAHFALFLLVQRSRLHLLTTALGVVGAGSALVLAATGVVDPAVAAPSPG